VKESSTPEEQDNNLYQPQSTPQNVSLVGEDIRFIKVSPDRVKHIRQPLVLSKTFWMTNMGILGLAFIILIFRLLAGLFMRDGFARRSGGIQKLSRKKLKSAQKHLKEGQENKFFEDLSSAVYNYFAEKLKMEVGAVGLKTLESKLSAALTSDEWGRVRQLFDELDYGRFAASNISLEGMKKSYEETHAVFAMMEKKRL
jgi:hypothetical protein